MTFIQGERVRITQGECAGETGTVVYQRMAPPTYAEAIAVSVTLDSKRDHPKYIGTLFNAAYVQPDSR